MGNHVTETKRRAMRVQCCIGCLCPSYKNGIASSTGCLRTFLTVYEMPPNNSDLGKLT